MLRAICLIVLAAFAAHAQERSNDQLKEQAKHFKNSKRFAITYDKFKDETWVRTGPFAISGTTRYMAGGGMIFLWASFRFSGQSLKLPIDTFALYLEHNGNDWQFLTTKEMYLLIDGHRDVLPAEQKGNVGRGGFGSLGAVNEILLTTVSPELFESLTTGKSVELRAGSYETKLKDEHQQAFRDLLSLARGEQKKP